MDFVKNLLVRLPLEAMPIAACLIARARAAWSFLLTKVNAVGSVVLAYALSYPTALSELMTQLPEPLRSAIPVGVPIAWFILIQFAKGRALNKGK